MLLIAASLLSLTYTTGYSQIVMNNYRTSENDEAVILSKAGIGSSVAVNQKAEKHFKRDYRMATGAEWSVLGDKSLMCGFFMDNTFYKAYYTQNGEWIGTLTSYDGSKLSKSIYDKVKSTYYDYQIIFVNQIDLARNKVIYIVEIQNEKSIKKLRVADNEDDIEVIREFEKN